MNYQPENTNRLGSTHEHVNIKKTEVNFVISLTDLFGSMYTLKRDFIVGYFFPMAMANRGCTFGIATKAFNLKQ